MAQSEYISFAALAISFLSLATSFYFGFRDRMSVKAECKYFPANPEYDRAHLKIRVTTVRLICDRPHEKRFV